MSVHIGLLIWKEMKKRSVTQAALAASLKIPRGKISTIINSQTIKTDTLYAISVILNHDFFKHYQPLADPSTQTIPMQESESDQLDKLLKEKSLMLDLAEKTILSQKRIIEQLEEMVKNNRQKK